MRRIVKTHAPRELHAWCEDNRDLNHTYEDLSADAYAALKGKLLEEQGAICAYTGRVISADTSHIEHLKPRAKCTEWEDVAYENVVACFPASGGDVSHGYGAPVKKEWWDEAEFVSPLAEDCERRFRFAWSGHVHPSPEDYAPAQLTIEKLGLDKDRLHQLRKARIDGFFGFGRQTRNRPLSIPDAKVALANIDRFDASGRLREFCFVLKQLLPKYIEQGGGQ